MRLIFAISSGPNQQGRPPECFQFDVGFVNLKIITSKIYILKFFRYDVHYNEILFFVLKAKQIKKFVLE